MANLEHLNKIGIGKLPGHLGIVVTHADGSEVAAEIAVTETHMAPNGYLHAGTVGFTTVELKSNHLGTAKEGTIVGSAKPVHLGKTTQVWDTVVTHKDTGKTIALFRCTQMILYAK